MIYSKNALKQFEKEFIEESEYSVFKKDDDPDKRQKVKFKTTFFGFLNILLVSNVYSF